MALTRDTAALAELAATVPGALAADLTTLHRRQHTVLRTTLVADGVPATALERRRRPPPPARDGLAGSGTRPRRAPRARGGGGRVRGAPPPASRASRTTCAHRRVAPCAAVCRGEPPRRAPADRALEPVGGDRVGALAAATAGAVYFLEVVSARSTGGQRARSDTTLAALRGLLADQLAGGARPDTRSATRCRSRPTTRRPPPGWPASR